MIRVTCLTMLDDEPGSTPSHACDNSLDNNSHLIGPFVKRQARGHSLKSLIFWKTSDHDIKKTACYEKQQMLLDVSSISKNNLKPFFNVVVVISSLLVIVFLKMELRRMNYAFLLRSGTMALCKIIIIKT